MVRDEIKHAARLERRDRVPDEARTPERDAAADWIEENAADEWIDWTLSDAEAKSEWSRQHISNVLDRYFKPASEVTWEDIDGIDDADAERVRELLGDATGREVLIYRLGYRDGWRDAAERS